MSSACAGADDLFFFLWSVRIRVSIMHIGISLVVFEFNEPALFGCFRACSAGRINSVRLVD